MLINYRERHRRMREVDDEAWAQADDQGLREIYEGVSRMPLRLLCCQLSKEVNHGGVLRAAEAFRIERVCFSPEEDRAVDGSGHRGTKRWQPHEWLPVADAMEKAKADGYRLTALTLSERTVGIDAYEWTFPMALVIGGELAGIDPEIEARCDDSIGIPLFGLVQSLNVAVAAAIALREAAVAYGRIDSAFEPIRNSSRRLLGLQPIDYRSS